jgi:rod shape-determining protein MreC
MTFAVAALAAVDAIASHAPSRAVSARLAPLLRPVTARVAAGFAWTTALSRTGTLASENLRLQDELTRMRADEGAREDAFREAAFLRELSGLDGSLRRMPREASVFTYGVGIQQNAMLDHGTDAEVSSGDIVITATGALVGRVEDVGDRWARVRLLTDASLEVTAHVLGTDIGGLVRVDALDGLVLDLVNKDEAIAEGQTVVTSGDDRFPAGIVIGTVRAVDTERTTLFAIVRITPAVAAPVRGRVIVIQP